MRRLISFVRGLIAKKSRRNENARRQKETARILAEVDAELRLTEDRCWSSRLTDGVNAARYFKCIFGTKGQRDLAIRFMKVRQHLGDMNDRSTAR